MNSTTDEKIREEEAIDALTNLTSSPIPASKTKIIQDKNALTQSLFAAVAAAALSGQLQQQTSHPETTSPPTILQIQSGLKTVIDLVSTYQSKHSLELLAQIMDAVSTHCEVLGLSPDEPITMNNHSNSSNHNTIVAVTALGLSSSNISNNHDNLHLSSHEKLEFWKHLNEAWLFAIQFSSRKEQEQQSSSSFSSPSLDQEEDNGEKTSLTGSEKLNQNEMDRLENKLQKMGSIHEEQQQLQEEEENGQEDFSIHHKRKKLKKEEVKKVLKKEQISENGHSSFTATTSTIQDMTESTTLENHHHQDMNEEDWIALRDSVIAWGDVLEWYGLVDYEMGFWEEDILNAIHLQIHQLKLRMLS